MAEYHSGSSLRKHFVRNLLLPTNPVLLLYIVISLVMLIFINLTAFGQLFVGEPITIGDLSPLTDRFSDFQDRLSTPLVMVFWLFIGAAVYTSIWLAENVFFIARSEVEASKFISSNPTVQKRYLQSTLASNGFLILMVVVGVSLIALYLRVLLPAFSDLFHDSLSSAPFLERLFDFIAAVIGNTVSIYFILLMRRVITYSWRANRP